MNFLTAFCLDSIFIANKITLRNDTVSKNVFKHPCQFQCRLAAIHNLPLPVLCIVMKTWLEKLLKFFGRTSSVDWKRHFFTFWSGQVWISCFIKCVNGCKLYFHFVAYPGAFLRFRWRHHVLLIVHCTSPFCRTFWSRITLKDGWYVFCQGMVAIAVTRLF